MSLGIAIKAPEGIVLAAESRVTLTASVGGEKRLIHFDNATKIFDLEKPTSVGVVTYGMAAIGLRTAHSFHPELESYITKRADGADGIRWVARALSDFYLGQWQATMPADYGGPPMTFLVAGFDDENAPYGRVFQVDIPHRPVPVEHNAGEQFGLTWGGQQHIVQRLIRGYDPIIFEKLKADCGLADEQIDKLKGSLQEVEMKIPLNAMALQDAVDLALFFIRTTITAQQLTVGVRGCGGFIDLATITRRGGIQYVQRKKLRGELGPDRPC